MGEVWVLFGMSVFGLLLPHLAAGEFEDAKPLRMMALAVFVVTAAVLADVFLFDEYFGRSLIASLETAK
jgi:hypothetical protein